MRVNLLKQTALVKDDIFRGLLISNLKQVVSQEDQTLNVDATIYFLRKPEEAYPQKDRIYLFCDNAGYYRNKQVRVFPETSKIFMLFLPPYSPNLNPIERLCKRMKQILRKI